MKKMLFVIVLCLLFSSAGKATCWGSVVTGHNGHSYCLGSRFINWYAAFAWCDAQGRHLASINEACDYDDYVYGQNTQNCENFRNITMPFSNGSSTAWVSTPASSSGAALAINGANVRDITYFHNYYKPTPLCW